MLQLGFLLLVLALSSFAAHERRESAPSGFKSVGPAPLSQVVTLRISIAQNDFKGLEDDLYAVSTPGSTRYGKHLSKSEVEQRIAPSKESLSAFHSWISSNGLNSTSLSPTGDWQAVDMTIRQANQLLAANFSMFEHQDLNTTVTRTLSYSLPEPLLGHVSTIHPTVVFPIVGWKPSSISLKNLTNVNTNSQGIAVSKRDIPTSCNEDQYSLPCVLDLYGIPKDAATQSSNHLWVSGFDNSFANKQDLATFLTTYRPDMSNTTTFDLATIKGGINPQLPIDASFEGDIDTQFTVGIATDVPITFMSVGTGNPDDPITDILDQANYLLSLDTLPQALVSTYPLNENQISQPLATQLCNAYAQLGARGLSIVHTVGLGGVGGASPFRDCTEFDVSFPASCPYVTSVGGTQFNDEGDGPETPNDWSSGGFSNYFPRPSYQDSVVPPYIESLGSTYAGLYNASGRGIPDVSAHGQGTVYLGGYSITLGTPAYGGDIFISIIALLNDLLIAKGKSPLGFLNPWIYANKGIFTDITSGNNPGCNTNGFNSTAGWDPISGMGSPLFAAMKEAAGL